MSAKIVNQYGSIEIDKQVISQVAYRAAMESYGLVGLGYKSKGIVELLKGENAFKGVVVEELEDNTISIELYVILQYGTNISTVANNIICTGHRIPTAAGPSPGPERSPAPRSHRRGPCPAHSPRACG